MVRLYHLFEFYIVFFRVAELKKLNRLLQRRQSLDVPKIEDIDTRHGKRAGITSPGWGCTERKGGPLVALLRRVLSITKRELGNFRECIVQTNKFSVVSFSRYFYFATPVKIQNFVLPHIASLHFYWVLRDPDPSSWQPTPLPVLGKLVHIAQRTWISSPTANRTWKPRPKIFLQELFAKQCSAQIFRGCYR